jgi:hypothetical protein
MKTDNERCVHKDLPKKISCDEFQSIIQPKTLNKTTENSAGDWPKFEQDLIMNTSRPYSVAITPKIRVMTGSYK